MPNGFVKADEPDGARIADAWSYPQYTLLFLGIAHCILQQLRPWPDEAHISHKDVKQLRQLIQLRTSQNTPHLGYARVIERRGAALLIRPHNHGAKLQDIKGTVMVATA